MKIRAKKSLGQNFLIDKNIIKKIVNTTNIKDKVILEIGPGTGNLTKRILDTNPKYFCAIEKDKELYLNLKNNFSNFKKFDLINKDILKINLEKILKKETIIFGNLPYNISTKILTDLIGLKTWPPKYKKLILMFQKEVADRIKSDYNLENAIISVFDLNGRRVLNYKNTDGSNLVDLTSLSIGEYILRVISFEGNIYSTKVLKK